LPGGPVVPFNAASHMYVERFTRVLPAIIGAAAIDVSPTQNAVQTYGYLRSILCWGTPATNGTGGNLALDAPQNILQQLSLTDPNGAEIYGGPVWSGFDAYVAEKYGAYYLVNDFALSPLFTSSATAPRVPWRIWLEMNANSGLGSLPNMDAQSPYKLKATQNTAANIFQTAPTTAPIMQFDYYIEAWTVPEPVNRITGQPQAIAPLGLGAVGGLQNGATVQHWTKASPTVTASSAFTLAATRKGNIFRNVVLVVRNSSSVRQTLANGFPAFLTYAWDGAPIYSGIDPNYLVERFYRQAGGQASSTNVTQDTGVISFPYADPSGVDAQGVSPDSFGWNRFVGTVQSSRIEWSGTWGANAGFVDILTNDVNFVDLTGSPYSFGFSQQLQAPAQPQIRT
jgi:hypothetical protein